MPAKLPWIQRRWAFDFPVEVFPDILERLRGTPVRVEEMVGDVPAEVLTRREKEGTWSVRENIGHLSVVEQLWWDRLDDFLAGSATLRAADMSNRRTHEAGSNDRDIGDLLGEFRAARGRLMARLGGLADADFSRTALHPRLDTPMRLVDMCLFAADHDDYHLARIRELMRS